jgi:hypothetical protein
LNTRRKFLFISDIIGTFYGFEKYSQIIRLFVNSRKLFNSAKKITNP